MAYTITDDDLRAVAEAGSTLGIDPSGILRLFFNESGFNPGSINSIGCVGLNQFCPGTFEGAVNLSPDQYRSLSAAQQIRSYILPWWQAKPAVSSARDLYWLNFLPATYVYGADDSHVITSDPGIVEANPGFSNGKSYITAGDLAATLNSISGPRFDDANARLAALSPTTGLAKALLSKPGLAAAFSGLLVGAVGYYAWETTLRTTFRRAFAR